MTQQPASTVAAPPIAIIGMGCLFPKSDSLKAFWHLLYRGINAVDRVPDTHWSIEDYYDQNPDSCDRVYCQKGGFLPPIEFDPTEFGIPPNILEATDTSQLLGLVVAKAALDNAGYGNGKPFDRDRTSVIIGVTGTQELVIPLGARLGFPLWRQAMEQKGLPDDQIESIVDEISKQYVTWQESSFPGLLGNVVAGRISNRLDLHGTNCVVDAACASSMSAIHMAALELGTGRSEMVITGGIDTLNDVFMHMCFAKTKTLSSSGDAKPFSEDADGTVLGEGLGLMVLKRLDTAERDGDRIYAVIRAIGSASDGRSQSIYAPRKSGQIKAITKAYQTAQVDPGSVSLLEAHGTGTRKGDAVEFEALRSYFGQHRPNGNFCALGSVKSNIGHTKAAAGAAGIIKTALALHHKVLPPTLKAQSPDPQLKINQSPFYLNQGARPWIRSNGHPRRAGVSAFGFGGSNFHAVLEEYPQTVPQIAWEGTLVLAAFGAATAEDLKSDLLTWTRTQQEADWHCLAHAAHLTCREFDTQAPLRLVWVINRARDTSKQLKVLGETLEQKGLDHPWQKAPLFFSNQPPNPKTAFLFPGQGSQYPQMAQDLFCLFPQALDILQTADPLGNSERPLSEILFPTDPKTAVTPPTEPGSIHFTANAQPAIGAVSAAMQAILSYFEITPDMVAGHSFGELSALHAAGCLDQDTFLRLATIRGQTMAEAGALSEDPGTMLAVKGPLHEIAAHIAERHPKLVVANRNTPLQAVVAGSRAAIQEFKETLKQTDWQAVPLTVSAAFHTPLVADAQQPFAKAVQAEIFESPVVPLYGNTDAQPYPHGPDEIKGVISRQLSQPVDFVGMIDRMYADGARLFVEVGPKQVLSGLTKAILGDRPHTCLAMDGNSPSASSHQALAQLLAQMAVHGRPVALDKWENFATAPPTKRMRVTLSGTNYRNPAKTAAPATTPSLSHPDGNRTTKVLPKSRPSQTPSPQPKTALSPSSESAPRKDSTISPSIPRGQVSQALEAVSQGLKSMQALQEQTAQAHQRFLEVQAEAGRTLQQLITSTQWLTGQPLPAAISTAQPATPASETMTRVAPLPAVPATQSESMISAAQTVPLPSQSLSEKDATGADATVATHLSEGVLTVLREIVSELTGYPEETLAPDQNLESDLGIDSIKRVEIFSALENRLPDLPKLAPEDLARLQTLGEIAGTLIPGTDARTTTETQPPNPNPAIDAIYPLLAQIVAELTGYPEATLAPDQDLESDLGIDSIKRVEIFSALESRLPDLPKTAPEVLATLKSLEQIAAHFGDPPTGLQVPAASSVAAGPTMHKNPAIEPASPARDMERSSIGETLLAIVSDLTGYPAETLQLDQDLESDLGIDSIKRVEIFSALEAQIPNLPKMLPEQLATLKTLAQVIAYFGSEATPMAIKMPAVSAVPAHPTIQRRQIAVRSWPTPSFPSSTEACRFNASQTIYVTDDGQGLASSMIAVLSELGIGHHLVTNDQIQQIVNRKQALTDMAGLIIVAPRSPKHSKVALEADVRFLKTAFQLARSAAPKLMAQDSQSATFLATVTNLDGAFGFKAKGVNHPVLGGLAGLVKTAAIEWPQVRCRAFDLAPESDDLQALARQVVLELVCPAPKEDAGAMEIGLEQIGPQPRINRLELIDAPLPAPAAQAPIFTPEDVFIITGGGRGITAEVAITLASQIPATWILMGRSPAPRPEPEWLRDISEEGAMKRAILANAFKSTNTPQSKGVSPKELEIAYRQYAADRQICETLTRLQQLGVRGQYLSVDVRDAGAVTQTVQEITRTFGPIRGLVHAAGTLADRLIIDKSDNQFDQVFDTKVQGLFNLLGTLDLRELRYTLFFSSVTARFGNQGQVDYAMANEVLNKVAQNLSHTHPHIKVSAFNWGPWDGGMVTPSLKQTFAQRGVDLIPIQEGAAAVYWEMLSSPKAPVEMVWGASLAPSRETPARPTQATSVAQTEGVPLFLSFKRKLDLQSWPILRDHTLEGKPVVPLALISEFIGHGVLLDNPGLQLFGFDNLRLLKGIILDEEQKLLRLMAGKPQRNGNGFKVEVELRNGFKGGRDVIHSRATALLKSSPPEAPQFKSPLLTGQQPYARSMAQMYDEILFHGTQLHGIQRISNLCEKGIVAEVSTAPAPQNWIAEPLQPNWLQDPLALDCAFQMAIVWAYEQKQRVCLPTFYASYRQYRSNFPKPSVTTVYEVHHCSDHKTIGDITFLDANQQVVAQLKGYEAVFKSGGF